MTICHRVLTPIVVLVRTLVQVVREVVRTICEWVSSVITTIKKVVERVCTWMPWPLSELCKLVTRFIEVVETVWKWVCREVIERIIEWIEKIVEYIVYIVRWVCWVLTWPIRAPALLLCLLGLRPRRFLHVCIRVLTDARGNPAVDWAKVQADVTQAQAILRRCNIELVVIDGQRVPKPEFLDGTTCDFAGMFTDFFTWFSARECAGCSAVTVYYVRSIPGAIGCAYPGTNWVTVAAGGDGRTMVQEIGHLADLWGHSSDPNNVMTDQPGGTADQITSFQCCMLRTSRFGLRARCLDQAVVGFGEGPLGEHVPTEREAVGEVSLAFQAVKRRADDSQPVRTGQIVRFAAAAIVVAWAGRRLARVRGN